MKRNRTLKNKRSKGKAKYKAYKTSAALDDNIIAPITQENELDLFAGRKQKEIDGYVIDSRTGKRVPVTGKEFDIIDYINMQLAKREDDEEIKAYIRELPSRIKDRVLDKDDNPARLTKAIEVPLNVGKIARKVYCTNNPSKNHYDAIRKAIDALLNKKYIFEYYNKDKTLLRRLKIPFFYCKQEDELYKIEIDPKTNEVVKKLIKENFSKITIILEEVFLFEYNVTYDLESEDYFERRKKLGIDSDLFNTIVRLMRKVRGVRIKWANIKTNIKAKEDKERAQLLNVELDKEQEKNVLAEFKENELTYKESLLTTWRRVAENKRYRTTWNNGKTNRNLAALRADLEIVGKALIKGHYVTKFEIDDADTAPDGSPYCKYTIDEKGLKTNVE